MSWISLTAPIYNGMVVYKNQLDKQPSFEKTRSHQDDSMQESTLHLPLHTGTHIDYPIHAIKNGKCSSDYTLFPCTAKGYILDLSSTETDVITPDHFNHLALDAYEFLFFKTMSEKQKTFDFNFPYLTQDSAKILSSQSLKFVGIDHLGIERNQPNHETHKTLLSQDILIIEGLQLFKIQEGPATVLLSTMGLKEMDAEPIIVLAKN